MEESDSLDDERNPWQQRYEQHKTGWDRGSASPALLSWLDEGLLEDVTTVLVPGCGRGHEVVELASRGFDVTAIDFAPAAIKALTTGLYDRNVTATVFDGSLFEFTAQSSFDAIYEQTCICALHPDRWASYEAQLFRWLRPRGSLFALFMQTNKPDGPPFHCPIDDMKMVFDNSRWDWPLQDRLVDHPAGLQEIATVIRRKNAKD